MTTLTSVDWGVMEKRPVRGLRYDAPTGMSGWWLTTDVYDGTNSTMRNEHTYHLAATRDDVVEFLALPAGFCFYVSEERKTVWFDDRILDESAQ